MRDDFATFRELFRRHWQPPDRSEIWEWAAREVELPAVYAVPGRFDASRVPFVKEPFRALKDPLVRAVVAQSGVQCLKTLIGEVWLLWMICENPGPSQWLQPTDQDAKEHCEERFNTLLESCALAKGYFSENRHERRVSSVVFRHMFLRMEGAESMSNLQRKSIKNQMCSEVWLWTPGRLSEAAARQTQFTYNSKRYVESQAGVAGDDMDLAFQEGSQEVWQFACLGCGWVQPFRWTVFREDGSRGGMTWEDSPRTRQGNGEWNFNAVEPTVRYVCARCGYAHADEPRIRRLMSQSGRYVRMNPGAPARVRSFSWNQLACESISWFSRVQMFLRANGQAKLGIDGPLREFFQKVLAEPYDADKFNQFTRLPAMAVESGENGKFWAKQDFIFLTVDVQATHFWYLVTAWSKAGDCCVLDAGMAPTWGDIAAVQERFAVPNQCVFVDGGDGLRRSEILAECTRHGHRRGNDWLCWWMLIGTDRDAFAHAVKRGGAVQKVDRPYSWPAQRGDPCHGRYSDDPVLKELRGKYCRIVHWSNPTVKDIARNRRDELAKGVRTIMSPGKWNTDFSKQMHSEVPKQVTDTKGYTHWRWERIGKRANHLWDCFCMATVAATMAGCLGEVMACSMEGDGHKP